MSKMHYLAYKVPFLPSGSPEFIHMFNDDDRLGFICKKPPVLGDKFFYLNDSGSPVIKELLEITSINNMGDKYKGVITNYSPVFYVMSVTQTVPLLDKDVDKIIYLIDKSRHGEEIAMQRKAEREAKKKELAKLEKSKDANRFGIS